jgi:hypothetical protein
MQWDMVDRGLKLYEDMEVRAHHWNCSRLLHSLGFSWYFSREFAAFRVRHITSTERAKLALLWPLIPAIRLKRLWPCMTLLLGYRGATRMLLPVALNLLVSGAAEGLGYLTGKVGSSQKCLDREFHRERFLRSGERLTVPEPSKAAKTPQQRQACAANATA